MVGLKHRGVSFIPNPVQIVADPAAVHFELPVEDPVRAELSCKAEARSPVIELKVFFKSQGFQPFRQWIHVGAAAGVNGLAVQAVDRSPAVLIRDEELHALMLMAVKYILQGLIIPIDITGIMDSVPGCEQII